MKLAAAQITSTPGMITQNIAKHIAVIEQAARHKVDGIFFPELSLTGYEPTLAQELAIDIDDKRLNVFEQLSEQLGLLIAVGVPLRVAEHIQIAMLVFQPNTQRQVYAKQQLHADEYPFFSAGDQQLLLTNAKQTLAPAICFESLQESHAKAAATAGATLYFASVAKSERGLTLANSHYPYIAKQYGMAVIMANCVGPADNFIGAGGSAIWNAQGERLAQAGNSEEALLIYNSETCQGQLIVL